jgi:hypothetical protein
LPGRADITPEAVRAWVEASCAAQGLAVAVTDLGVVADVAVLLGAASRPQAAGAPSRRPQQSDTPDRTEPARVEAVEAATTGADDEMVEDGSHDRVLAMQRESLPPLAQPSRISDESLKRDRAA